ncbi:HAD family acid phosphatase [Ammonicoccus fulvus]|uniref:HAD family acid phosphatase n=1 Tax=Ammonicoccus fulvus TaxID=3138240 RepID=A0ABZ3FLY1_9ACTN
MTEPILRPLAVFDLDGTLTDTRHRQRFVETKPKQWDRFFAGAADDGVHAEGRAALEAAVEAGCEIVYLTGRPQRLRRATEQWLRDHGFPEATLIVRRDGDRRSAVVFKIRELAKLAEGRQVAVFVDDDPDVIAAVRGRSDLVAEAVLADWQPRVVSTPQEQDQLPGVN